MKSYEAITQKIIEDSTVAAERIIDESEKAAEALLESVAVDIDAKNKQLVKEIENIKKSIVGKKTALADSECKKIMSGAKKAVIDEAFSESLNEIFDLPQNKYKELIAAMLFSAAQDGDIVVISERDKGVVTAKFVKSIADKLNIKLTLSDKYGNFNGGVILSSENLDKNLTLDLELVSLREEIEPEIALILDAK